VSIVNHSSMCIILENNLCTNYQWIKSRLA